MSGLALDGATLVACARVHEGMSCVDEATATALAGEATVPVSGAWVLHPMTTNLGFGHRL
jgi:hypothetical protein